MYKAYKFRLYPNENGFNKICQLLKWKCQLDGKYYYQVDTYFPSSKKCSHCYSKMKVTNDLEVRNWICGPAGMKMAEISM